MYAFIGGDVAKCETVNLAQAQIKRDKLQLNVLGEKGETERMTVRNTTTKKCLQSWPRATPRSTSARTISSCGLKGESSTSYSPLKRTPLA